MGLGKERIAQLVDRLAGFGDGKLGGLLQRAAGIGALQKMGLGLARDVFFNARGNAVAARCRHRLRKDTAVFVQDGIGGFGCGFAKEAGEQGHGMALTLVMVTTLGDFQHIVGDTIDQPMLTVDPARSPPRIIAPKRFRLTRTLKGVALAFGDQAVDLGKKRAIKPLPFDILVKGAVVKDDVQSRAIASNSSIVLTMAGAPAFKPRIASSSAALFAGEEVR